jgi:uncharacterized protein
MDLTPQTKIGDLLMEYPFLVEFLPSVSPKYGNLKNPLVRKTMGRFATLAQAAELGGLDEKQLIEAIAGEVRRRSGVKSPEEVKQALKTIIRQLHSGGNPKALKARFSGLIRGMEPSEIPRLEQELISEGMPEAEIKRLCDVHVEVFRESLEAREKAQAPPGHPIHTLMRENEAAERVMAEIDALLVGAGGWDSKSFSAIKHVLQGHLERLTPIEVHYQRKENQLFPLLETKGFTGPSKVMWELHDDIRDMLKQSKKRVNESAPAAISSVKALLKAMRDMVYKEEHILYPAALEALSAGDWAKVRAGEEGIGYAWVEPEAGWVPGSGEGGPDKTTAGAADSLALDVGRLTAEQVNLMVNHLPLEISFVDEEDRVAFYSHGRGERIFPRSPAVIGRKVQNCHPPKSVHVVEDILADFRSGRRDSADFWIDFRGRFVLIRYFAVRDAAGKYGGTLEITQDVTGIRGLVGEKRLLDPHDRP